MNNYLSLQLPERVKITDVVARDGFQNEGRIISTEDKIQVIEGLVQAGVTSIEVTSFVHPKVVPQLADADALLTRLPRYPEVIYSALVPNVQGARRALAAGISELHLVVSASESHNRANLNRSVRESLAQLAEVCSYATQENPQVVLTTSIATAFHCPFEGYTAIGQVLWMIERLAGMGIRQINLADTDGAVAPLQIQESLATVKQHFPEITFSLHLHNTRDMGLANALAGLQAGIVQFDSSLGGLGGCPFAPGATGNISTEDLVHMLHEMGIETDIDLDRLIAEGRKLRELVGHDLACHVSRAGKSNDLHPFTGVKIASSHDVQASVHSQRS